MELFNKIKIKDMKSGAVFALTLWTILSPALAAIRTACASESDPLAYCTDSTNGDANAICGTTNCECSAAYKEDSGACVAKGLTDTCAADTDCADVANAVCDGTSTACVCSGAYKDNTAGDGCEAKGLTDTCSANTDCAGVTNAVCDGTSTACVCSGAYKDNTAGDGCEAKGLTDDCTDVADCAGVTNAVCTSDICSCDTQYVADGAMCIVLGSACQSSGDCSAVSNATCTDNTCACISGYKKEGAVCTEENGARGMTANIGLLCGILMMLSSVNTL